MAEKNRKENEIYSLIPAFSFRVSFSGALEVDNVPFVEVSGINMEIPYDEISEGGVNNTVYKLPKPIKLLNLVLKKGAMPKPNEFLHWCNKAIYDFQFEPCNVKVDLVNGDEIIKYWDIKNAYPVKLNISSFDANKNEIVIETIELAYSEVKYSEYENI